MAKARINNLQIQYETVGSGPDLVMAHGLAANLAFWFLRVVPYLKANFRVTLFDLRGHGHTDMPLSGYTTADMASDLIGLLDYLKIGRAHVVGHSFGGAVSLHAAALHPERIESLTLVDARVHSLQPLPSGKDSPFWRARRKKMLEQGIAVPEDTPKVVYTMLEELGGPAAGRDEADSGLAIGPGSWNPNSRTARQWLTLRSTTSLQKDVRKAAGLNPAAIRKVESRTLLIYGENSRCMKSGLRLGKLMPRCETVVLPGVGHFFPVEVPDVFAGRLKEFIANDPDASRQLVVPSGEADADASAD